MISQIDHVSIAVRDHRKAVDFFCSVLGAVPGSSSVDRELKFLGAVLSLGDLRACHQINVAGSHPVFTPSSAGTQSRNPGA
jgi:catechol 2,3-dioxygenase-like lactoylglutathione lyase family enzyme